MSVPHPSIPVTYALIDREHLRVLVRLIDDTVAGYDYDPEPDEQDALDAARKAVGA
jgi:hypothetical protein